MQGEFIEICPLIRRKWIQMLSVESENKNIPLPCVFARNIEAEIMKRLQKNVELEDGVTCQRYGDVDLLDMESFASHVHYASMYYCKSMQRIISAVSNTAILGKDTHYLKWLDIDDSDLIKGTSHDAWLEEFLEQKNFAKKTLEGKSNISDSSTKGIFQCPSCKSFEVDIDQKQTRSADEPMTNFCTCKHCNKMFVR